MSAALDLTASASTPSVTSSPHSPLNSSGIASRSSSAAFGRVSMSPLRVISQLDVTCLVCCEQFDPIERRPELLPCLHPVCSVCFTNNNPSDLACPVCGQETPQAMIDVIRLAFRQDLMLKPRQCDRCRQSSCPSLFWDSACGLLACQACYDVHESAPNVHKLGSSVIEITTPVSDELYRQVRDTRSVPCPLHDSEVIDQYCFECSAFACSVCVVSRHQDHVVCQQLDLDAMFVAECDAYRNNIDNMTNFVDNIEENRVILQAEVNQVETWIADYENRAKQLFSPFFSDQVNQHKQQTMEVLHKIREKRQTELRQNDERLGAAVATGKRLLQLMAQAVDLCNAVELSVSRNVFVAIFQHVERPSFSLSWQISTTAPIPLSVLLPQFESAVQNFLMSAYGMPSHVEGAVGENLQVAQVPSSRSLEQPGTGNNPARQDVAPPTPRVRLNRRRRLFRRLMPIRRERRVRQMLQTFLTRLLNK